MVRVLNTLCVALMGLSILALYHVSERTRVATVELHDVDHEIAREQAAMSVLETEWAHDADPNRIQTLAMNRLGLASTPSVELSSFDQLPRRGEEAPALGNTPLHNASAIVPSAPPPSSNSGQPADAGSLGQPAGAGRLGPPADAGSLGM